MRWNLSQWHRKKLFLGNRAHNNLLTEKSSFRSRIWNRWKIRLIMRRTSIVRIVGRVCLIAFRFSHQIVALVFRFHLLSIWFPPIYDMDFNWWDVWAIMLLCFFLCFQLTCVATYVEGICAVFKINRMNEPTSSPYIIFFSPQVVKWHFDWQKSYRVFVFFFFSHFRILNYKQIFAKRSNEDKVLVAKFSLLLESWKRCWSLLKSSFEEVQNFRKNMHTCKNPSILATSI